MSVVGIVVFVLVVLFLLALYLSPFGKFGVASPFKRNRFSDHDPQDDNDASGPHTPEE